MTQPELPAEAAGAKLVGTRYVPLCRPPELPHPGFDEAPDYVTYERIETFADGSIVREIIDGATERTQSLCTSNSDFVDEDHVAGCLARVHVGRLRYVHELHAWFVWDGTIWRRDTTDKIMLLIRFLIRDLATGNARALLYVGTAHFLLATERVARSEPTLATPMAAFDADLMQLGTPDGMVDLVTGEIAEPCPTQLVTRATATGPSDEADCPLWRRFLDEATGGDEALQVFLQRFLGTALTGDTSEHALLFLHGDGGNGKTVFLNTIAGILGDYAEVAVPNLLAARAPSAELAKLRGARLVTLSETDQGRWDEAQLKRLTGGEPVTAHFPREKPFTYRPGFKLICAGNRLPQLHHVDAAIRRRLRLVPFGRIPLTPDRRLEARLRDEWPDILRWMIEGCRDWQANGLDLPPRVREATDAYLGGQDIFGQFLDEACDTKAADAIATSQALYAAWTAWAAAAGEPAGSQRAFAAALDARGFARVRHRHARLYRGLRLLAEEERGVTRDAV